MRGISQELAPILRMTAPHGVTDIAESVGRTTLGVDGPPSVSDLSPPSAAAFLVWFSLAVGFRSRPVFAITCLYVIPIYVLYICSEESMLVESFGNEYRDYCHAGPMLHPASAIARMETGGSRGRVRRDFGPLLIRRRCRPSGRPSSTLEAPRPRGSPRR
jgi:hypothetical protein